MRIKHVLSILLTLTTPSPAVSTNLYHKRALTKVQAAGINIAGCDFGCKTDGNCTGQDCPTGRGTTQIKHFVNDDKFNFFRLPVAWQSLVNNNLGGSLDPNFFGKNFDPFVRSCLDTGAFCLIDLHNYGRWYGGIVGQGGPTNDQFASLWSQLATHYKNDPRLAYGLMNEPHDLDMTKWAATLQQAVTAIRNASGRRDQWILLPGTNYSSATLFAANSEPYLATIRNPDNTDNNLFYDIHQYYDLKSTGYYAECTQNHINDTFAPLATYLRQKGRLAFLSETGGGNVASCEKYVCEALDFLNQNADRFIGWTGWGAGSFDSTYALNESPNGSVDTDLVKQCISGKFGGPP